MTLPVEEDPQYIEARVRLVQRMDQGGVVLPSRLAEAFLNTPRHPFVPVFYRREADQFIPWRSSNGDASAWLAQVYADDSLITEVDGVHAEEAGPSAVVGVPTSSSTAPSLMADMLDALDLREGTRVLEVGTGTGYNAALLCHLAGAENVTTVDHSAGLTSAAQERLNALGLHPHVAREDGAKGFPARAPFDRIIATCSVRRIPNSWFDQCATGGLMVVPIKGTLAGGMLARLKKLPDGAAAGHILHTPAAFMPLLSGEDSPSEAPEPVSRETRESKLSGSVLDDWTFSFFAQLHMDPSARREYRREPDGTHITTLFDARDGSCTRVADEPEGPGAQVHVSGPRDLWAPIERAHETWLALNRPRREWFTITASPDGQAITYTDPSGKVHQWAL
ncbi:methyltransferase domain-containing protein [Streptomyces aidingensis]|uniref:Protein-L-isoaspartate O-methyltransferase n=1 Tax=Streptomyces aidingensis TaxID=910347 RepID=A0A1I1GL41_9ACTN|nr:methyltransferase domain-containing protein [Streptomyces aidingensis]SFC12186.1 protein-L-isoaspartate(D-aspartate) O-methyltransferase [Streptomyces aidingensis]